MLLIGEGVTDQRVSDTLFIGCTRGFSAGFDDSGGSDVNLGGGGTQMTNTHFTYTGMPSGGWHMRLGSQAGDCMFTNIYFDQHGDAYGVRVGNVNNLFVGCHFLPAPACAGEGPVRVATAGSQHLIVMGCNANLNGSAVRSLVWYSAKAGVPDNGVVANNMVYGTGTAWLGFALTPTRRLSAVSTTVRTTLAAIVAVALRTGRRYPNHPSTDSAGCKHHTRRHGRDPNTNREDRFRLRNALTDVEAVTGDS